MTVSQLISELEKVLKEQGDGQVSVAEQREHEDGVVRYMLTGRMQSCSALKEGGAWLLYNPEGQK